MASALAPDAADELRRKHFSALRQAIAASGGSEVKNLGDGLMVVFPAASAALGCAVAMQQAVHRDNVEELRSLGLRVGLSSGEATREGDDYFGDPVIEAARLCAKAGAGQILVSDLVRANAGRRSSHSFSPLGELELKGLPEPIETLEVSWEPSATDETVAEGIPLPVRLGHRPGAGVIGREAELAALETAAKEVAAGQGRQIILISGEPGQGKTTLVSELAHRAHETGTTVLLGRCDEDVGAPYRPFQEALSHYVAHTQEEHLRSHVGAHGGELARLVPALKQRLGTVPPPQSTDADTERFLLYAAVVGLLEFATTAAPVVLVLDDLHWADKPSLQLLRHLVSNTSTARLLVVGTYRDAELSASHPLTEALAALHREPVGVSSIALNGLDDTGVIALMESAAGHELDDAGVGLAHQVYRETDGNPFFVAEMLRNLAESGAIFQDAATGRWAAADIEGNSVLPHSVRTVIGTRVSRLGDEATKILSTASVVGRDFDLDLLAEATKVDEDSLIDLLEEAQRAALVTELPDAPGRYSFSHGLVQHTLYEDLGPTRRTRVHRTVGEAIERLYGDRTEERIGELARHFLLATRPTEAEKAISYARRAGEAALKALAPDEAVRYLSQALELASQTASTDPTLRIDLLIRLGVAQRQAGMAQFRETLLEAAHEAQRVEDIDRLVTAVLSNSRGFFTSLGQVDADKVETLEAALDALGDRDTPERARLLATLCSELHYGAPLDRRIALADEANAIALRLEDRAVLVDVFARSAVAITAPTTLARQLAHSAAAIGARDQGDPPDVLRCLLSGVALAVRAGLFELAKERLVLMTDIAERLRQPALVWTATYSAASLAMLNGKAEEAEKLATTALDIGTKSEQPDAFQFYASQLMYIRWMQGRLGELVPLISSVAENAPLPVYKAVLAAAHLDAGDEALARVLLEEGASTSFEMPEDQAWFDGTVMYAGTVFEPRQVQHAEMLI